MSRIARIHLAALSVFLFLLVWPVTGLAAPTAQTILSGSQFQGGEPFSAGFVVQNDGPVAEVHFGLLLPDGVTMFRITAAGGLVGPVPRLAEMVPLEAAPPGFSHSAPTLFSVTIPTSGIPLGRYVFFAVLVSQGAILDNTIDNGDILALDVKFVTVGAQPILAGCGVFPPDNAWNTDISAFPVHPSSATFLASIGAGNLHPDFGTSFGIPFTTVPGPPVPIIFTDFGDESDPGPYPIPPNAPIEDGSDAHVLVLDPGTCLLYELFQAAPVGGGASWNAASGAIWNLNINATRPFGWTSADAAGLPILPGLVRFDEVAAGEIRHAVRFTVPQTQCGWIPPANHCAGSVNAALPPMGLRLRLRASFDISTFHPGVQVILRALQKYGMIVADNGSAWFISGAPDTRWDNDALDQLKSVSGSNFEVVFTGNVVIPP